MNANFKSWCFGAGGLCTGLLVALGVWLGRLPAASLDHQDVAAQMLLQAGGASQCDRFAACTGPVDDGGEGLFMLDFATGQLTAVVINGRTASIQARFETNVVAALGAKASDQPRYLLTSGVTDFRRTGGAVRPGASVIYVVDANTGSPVGKYRGDELAPVEPPRRGADIEW